MQELIRLVPVWQYTHANAVTLFRIALGVVAFTVCFPFVNPMTAFFLFAFAACTDGVDGWIARAYKCTSEFGKFFDPLADKVLSLCALGTLAIHYTYAPWIMIPFLVDVVYNPSTTAMRLLDKDMPTSRIAKWKTAIQFVAIGGLLFSVAITHSNSVGFALFPPWLIVPLWAAGLVLLWVATGGAVVSLVYYIKTSNIPSVIAWRGTLYTMYSLLGRS